MKKFFIGWIGGAIIMFVIGSTVGENKGTTDSFMFWWIIIWIGAGILYLIYWLLRVLSKAHSR